MKKAILNKRAISLLLALLMILSVAACGKDNSSDPNPSNSKFTSDDLVVNPDSSSSNDQAESIVVDKVTYGLRNNSWDLAPWKNNGSSGNVIFTQLYSGLMANPTFGTPLDEFYYDMAESVEFSADNMVATVKLRDYVHDSKGNPIKAEDVVFSYQTAPVVAGTYAKLGTAIAEIKVIDELTVEITAASAAAGTWELIFGNCPIVNKNWYENASDDEKSNDPATTGAYQVKENISGTSVTLVAVEDFWQEDELRTPYQTVNAKEVTFSAITEDAMRVMALENGELDIAWIENTSVALFEGKEDYNLFPFYMTNPTTLLFNCCEGSVFENNVNLRLAILHAIDFDQVRIAASGDFGFQGHDVAPAICGNYNKEWDSEPYYDYDLDVAKEYLEKAGYTEKNAPTIHFMCKTMAPQMAAVTVIQSCLKQIGIEVIIDSYDQALFDTYSSDPTQWDMSWQSGNMATGFVTEAWNWYYAEVDDNGTVGFVKDEKLQELLAEANSKNDAESLEAFHDYAVSMAYAVNAFNEQAYLISESGITGVHINFYGNAAINACTFAEGYVAAP